MKFFKKTVLELLTQLLSVYNLSLCAAFLAVAGIGGMVRVEFAHWLLVVAGLLMFCQPIVNWLLVTGRPERVSSVTILSLIIIQTSGVLLAYAAQSQWLLAGMALALAGSATLSQRRIAMWLASTQSMRLAQVGLWLVLCLVYLATGYAAPLLFGLWEVPRIVVTLAGPLMVFQVIAIWSFTKQAWLSAGSYNDLDWLRIGCFVLLQGAGSLLALEAGESYFFAAMFVSLIGTCTTAMLKFQKLPRAAASTPAE